MTGDRIVAALDEEWALIRAQASHCPSCAAKFRARLIAALDEVVALAGEWDANADSRGPAAGPSAKLHRKHAAALREAISAGLLREH